MWLLLFRILENDYTELEYFQRLTLAPFSHHLQNAGDTWVAFSLSHPHGRIIKGKNVTVCIRKGLRDSIVLPTPTYGCEIWNFNRPGTCRIHAGEMSCLNACVDRWDGASKCCSIYCRCGVLERGKDVGYGVRVG